jgi:hypothetical protein
MGGRVNTDTLLQNLLDRLLPNRAVPVLGRVIRAYEGPGKNRYSVDVRVLKAGTLEETNQVIPEVPLSPVWVGKKKRGLYAMPGPDRVVIVAFIEANQAFPFIAGIWSDEYEADEFSKDKFVITDGEDRKIVIDSAADTVTAANGKVEVVLKGDEAALRDGISEVVLKGGKATVTDGIAEITLNKGRAAVRNKGQSLFTILNTHITDLIAMQMQVAGISAPITPTTDTIAKLTATQALLALLLEA